MVIPARASASSLPRALASVRAQTYPNIVEVVVAAADDESASAADGAVVVCNPSGSTPAGLNAALARATGEVIVRCDARSVLPPDYVTEAVDALGQTSADNVGGMQVPVGETRWERAIAAAMSSRWGAGDARYRVGGDPGPAETVYLGVYRRDALERVGGFDEAFTRTQDYELNHRLIQSGGLVWFDPRLRVEYRPRSSLGALARQYFDYGRAKRQFARKHAGALRWRQLAPPALVVVLSLSLVLSAWWRWTLVAPAAYAVAVGGAGVQGDASAGRTALALATMHVSWGLGFLTLGAETHRS